MPATIENICMETIKAHMTVKYYLLAKIEFSWGFKFDLFAIEPYTYW